MKSHAIRILILLATTSAAGCSGSPKPPVPAPVRLIPVQPPICLRLPPPRRPAPPSCPLDQQPCADEYTASLLDWALKLESWSALAWTSCKGSQL